MFPGVSWRQSQASKKPALDSTVYSPRASWEKLMTREPYSCEQSGVKPETEGKGGSVIIDSSIWAEMRNDD